MTIKNIKFNKIVLLSALILFVALIAVPASAQTSSASGTTDVQKTIQRADAAIAQRIGGLDKFITRVNSMKKLSDAEKSGLSTSLQNEVNQLTALRIKIDADTDANTLKTDAQSVTKSYRIYMLVLPQASIAAASDRVLTIVGLMDGVVTKLQTRISQLPSGSNTTSIQSAMADITSKLSDATTQANAAVSETSSLVPDQGNTITAATNTATLKDARNKIKTAVSDLSTARQDLKTVVQGIKALKPPSSK